MQNTKHNDECIAEAQNTLDKHVLVNHTLTDLRKLLAYYHNAEDRAQIKQALMLVATLD